MKNKFFTSAKTQFCCFPIEEQENLGATTTQMKYFKCADEDAKKQKNQITPKPSSLYENQKLLLCDWLRFRMFSVREKSRTKKQEVI